MPFSPTPSAPPPGMHRADIIAAVRKRGTNLNELSRMHGYAVSTLRASITKRHPRAHKIIARVIGKRLHEIWPEFYGPDDAPLDGPRRRPARNKRLTRHLTPLLTTSPK